MSYPILLTIIPIVTESPGALPREHKRIPCWHREFSLDKETCEVETSGFFGKSIISNNVLWERWWVRSLEDYPRLLGRGEHLNFIVTWLEWGDCGPQWFHSLWVLSVIFPSWLGHSELCLLCIMPHSGWLSSVPCSGPPQGHREESLSGSSYLWRPLL